MKTTFELTPEQTDLILEVACSTVNKELHQLWVEMMISIKDSDTFWHFTNPSNLRT